MVVVKALKNVNIQEELAQFSETLQRDGGVYVSTLNPPLLIQTPIVTIATDLLEQDEPASFANLRVKRSTLDFFKEVETAILDLALQHKGTWFREDIADETIIQSVRSFIHDEERTVRVRVAESAVAFDDQKTPVPLPAAGTRAKVVLELARITFSKTQFGAVWNLKQVRLAEDPHYLFDDEAAQGIAEDIQESILAVPEEEGDHELETDLAGNMA